MRVPLVEVLPPTEEALKRAGEEIKRGRLVVFPTDTVYALGCDPFNERSVDAVFRAKGVAKVRPLPLLASDISDVERVAVITPHAEALAKKFWPGPLTMVLKAKVAIPATLYGDVVTVRIPGSEVARKIAFYSGGLVVGTGARSRGGDLPTTLDKALESVGRHVALAIDSGITEFKRPSTIVSLVGKPRVLRSGPIRRREIGRILSRV